jgi:hypothetical protein
MGSRRDSRGVKARDREVQLGGGRVAEEQLGDAGRGRGRGSMARSAEELNYAGRDRGRQEGITMSIPA